MIRGTPCPSCAGLKSRVVDVRPTRGVYVRRRRECACGHRYSTREIVWPPDVSDLAGKLAQAVVKALGGSR